MPNRSLRSTNHIGAITNTARTTMYAYAKTTAEKEAWRLAKESGMDLVVVNASLVVGPLLAPQPTSSLRMILAIKDDVVAAHILAMEESKADGRLTCSSSAAHWSQIIEMLRAKYPSYSYQSECSRQKGDNNTHTMDTSKIAQLGFPPFKTLEKMFDDCITSFQEKAFL
ncbi:tetraketide alpha-pyrone reductase 2 [Prunus yedoensis var. nudiflora]|uniref:Tetraketide alpha-pyrone reductase 2 n=1 Tax=Prunus yedoensis var. nudiflora TaxID=2094558 RepID=A0A314XPD4_PRUYE|nr:tetraketide alpha-pyrone reductase 2 [Prunus yedoensis var. nudiflora]